MTYVIHKSNDLDLRQQISTALNELESTVAQLETDLADWKVLATQSFVVAGYGGVEQLTPVALPNIGAGWTNLIFSTGSVPLPKHVVQDTVNNAVSFDKPGIFQFSVGFTIAHNESNGSREINIRLWNATKGISAASSVIGISRNQPVTNYAATFLVVGSPDNVGDLIQVQIGNGDTLTGVSETLASMTVVSVGEYQTIDVAELNSLMEWSVSSGLVTGDSLLVEYDGDVIFTQGYGDIGVADVVNLSSSTKTLIAMTVMMLVESTDIQLTSTLSSWIPAFGGTPVANATVSELLSHRGGVADMDAPPWNTTLEAYCNDVAANGDLSAPGSWDYSGTGYDLLARIVELASGVNYRTHIANALCTPLGMTETSFPRWGDDPEDAQNGYYVNAGGGLRSTLADQHLFWRMMLSSGSPLISSTTYDFMVEQKAYNPLNDNEYSTGQYCYGAYRDRVNPDTTPKTLSHGGSLGTFPWIDPDTGVIGVYFSSAGLGVVQALIASLQDIIRQTSEPS